MTFPTIISYYTQGTGYEREVKNLIASCQKLNIPCQIDSITSLGSWEENCCYKPRYILKKLDELSTPVLWVDADAVIVKRPTLFESMTADIALRVVDNLPRNSPSKMISGTVYFNQTAAAKTILHEWAAECQRMLEESQPEVWDQVALRNTLYQSNATIYPLSRAYYMIYDAMTTKCYDEAIIVHYQASRIFKKEINQLVVPFWSTEESSQEARKAFCSTRVKRGDQDENRGGNS
ncbi:MAG: putative nucleotide-diphospho-sugar transferase [Chlamydiota bacterium]